MIGTRTDSYAYLVVLSTPGLSRLNDGEGTIGSFMLILIRSAQFDPTLGGMRIRSTCRPRRNGGGEESDRRGGYKLRIFV